MSSPPIADPHSSSAVRVAVARPQKKLTFNHLLLVLVSIAAMLLLVPLAVKYSFESMGMKDVRLQVGPVQVVR